MIFSIGEEGKEIDVRTGSENIYFDIVVYDENYKVNTIHVYSKDNRDGVKSLAESFIKRYAKGGALKHGDFDYESFVDYIHSFYGKDGIYASDFGSGASDAEIKSAVDSYLADVKPENFGGGDSLDRERVRDIMLKARGTYANGGDIKTFDPLSDAYYHFRIGSEIKFIDTYDFKMGNVAEGVITSKRQMNNANAFKVKVTKGGGEYTNRNVGKEIFVPFENVVIEGSKTPIYSNGGSLKNSNMNNIEIQISKIDEALGNKNISNGSKTIFEGTRKKLVAQLEAEKVAMREADRASKKAAKIEVERAKAESEQAKKEAEHVKRIAELKAKQLAHGKHLKHTTKKPVKRKVKKVAKKKVSAPVRKKVVKKGKFHGLPKKVKKFNKGRSADDLRRDKNRDALPKGKRIARKGWMNQYGASKGKGVYYENRAGHADISKKHALGEGGNV